MIEERAREDIAFIRRAIEEGGAYAAARSPDMLVWGVAVAIGYLGTYAFIRGWSPIMPNALWAVCIGLPWLYSLRRQLRRLVGGAPSQRGPMAQALSMLWLGCGVLLTTLATAAVSSGAIRDGWFDAVVAGVLGTAFFASSWLANLPWLRWAAIAWWIGEVAIFASRRHSEMLLLAAALMLALLAGPGLFLLTRGGRLRR
ncbi:MAG TPA: hypothetical protein VEK82_04240 [Stellaceae bacterium]|nr:hypothetical protein [Stellaceae bacterium]